jgi:ribosomal subunit interface protein
MQIEHYEKDLRYTDRELLSLARKLGKMATYCKRVKDEASVIRVEAERRDTKKNTDEYKVMINVVLPRKMFRAESRKPTVLEAIDRCVEKLEPQLIKYKDMHTGRGLAKTKRVRKQRA